MTTNAAQIEHWNSDEARHWVDHQHRYDAMLAAYADRLLAGAAIGHDERVLDVGCGTGTTTLGAATAASDGDVLGIDISKPMIEQARRRASDGGLTNARFEVGDAQTAALAPGARDVVISRFGIMFFDDPTAAFTNIRAGMRDDGRLAFVCWQGLAQNEWMLVPGMAVAEVLPLPDTGGPDAPGPFAFGDPDRVRAVLHAAGFRDVELEPMVGPLLLGGGGSVDEAVDWLQGTGVARALFRDADDATTARAVDSVRAALSNHAGPEGIRLGAAAWLVRARR